MYRTVAKERPWAVNLTCSLNRGWAFSRVFLHSTPLFTYTWYKQLRAASLRASEPSQHICITGVITAHHVVFTAIKRLLRPRMEVPGPDTIDMDTQTQRLSASGVSYLRYV